VLGHTDRFPLINLITSIISQIEGIALSHRRAEQKELQEVLHIPFQPATDIVEKELSESEK